jgi:hypothetical protein
MNAGMIRRMRRMQKPLWRKMPGRLPRGVAYISRGRPLALTGNEFIDQLLTYCG